MLCNHRCCIICPTEHWAVRSGRQGTVTDQAACIFVLAFACAVDIPVERDSCDHRTPKGGELVAPKMVMMVVNADHDFGTGSQDRVSLEVGPRKRTRRCRAEGGNVARSDGRGKTAPRNHGHQSYGSAAATVGGGEEKLAAVKVPHAPPPAPPPPRRPEHPAEHRPRMFGAFRGRRHECRLCTAESAAAAAAVMIQRNARREAGWGWNADEIIPG